LHAKPPFAGFNFYQIESPVKTRHNDFPVLGEEVAMPAFNIVCSKEVDAPIERVRAAVSDFNTWPIWSPWLIMERDAAVTYKGSAGELGHGYDWEGKKVGAGGMVMTALSDTRMESDLVFLKPFKSKAKVVFDFEPVSESKTKVSWGMDSSLPFFMFFMVGKFKAFIRNDYNRGLEMLKDFVETGNVLSRVKVEGVVDVPATLYAGKTQTNTMDELSDTMGEVMPDVFNKATSAGAEVTGWPFNIYNDMDMVNQKCNYTIAVPIKEKVAIDGGVFVQERPACRAMKIVHTGAYRHLGNAWSTAMSDMRYDKLKVNKKIPPFEIYASDPGDTPENELVTEIYMPVK